LAACVAPRSIAVVTPVGPAPFERSRKTPEGDLLVYSAFDLGGRSDPDASPHHSDYEIYAADGKRLQYVNNWVATFSEDPKEVRLAPGCYSVVARAVPSGTLKLPVVIEAGKTTTVRLDGSKLPTGSRQRPSSEFVRLPNGFIVGWRAKENGEVK